MNNKDWIIFKTIAEEKNITKAAERLYISQPALTYRLKMIEKEMGTSLLTRTSGGVILTPEGEYFLSYADKMLVQSDKVKAHLQSMNENIEGTLRLGASAAFSYYELPKILKDFLALYPKVDLALKTGLSHRIHRLLQKDEVAIAIVRGDYYWNEIKALVNEEPLCIVSTSPLDLAQLPEKKLITYNTDTPLQLMIDKWCRESLKRPFESTMEVDSMDTCRQLVLYGIGWAILPAIGLQSIENLYIYPIQWPNGENVTRKTWLLARNGTIKSKLLDAFTHFVTHYYNSKE